MKKNKVIFALLALPIIARAQAADPATEDMNVSDVVVVEEIAAVDSTASPASDVAVVVETSDPVVVEIPELPIEGAALASEPEIAEVTTALPSDSDIVLELPDAATSGGEAVMAEEEKISVDFLEEDVRIILRNVADLFDLNLVIPETLQGRSTVKLRNITWRQVFEVVLEPFGYTYVEDRNIILIKSIEELTTEPVDTRVFVVNYAQAKDLQGSIAPLVDAAAGGRIQVDVRSNALIITERPSRMNKIQDIIDRLDTATEQVMIESKFVEVTDTDSKDLGINWSSLQDFTLQAASDLTSEDGSLGGITRQIVREGGETILRADTAVLSADAFQAVVSALDSKNNVELVSNPTVVTLNNTQAKIAIGQRYPIPKYTFNAETGTRQLDDIEFEDIGINLDVTPQVNSAGFINMKIIPEVSSTEEFALIEGTQIPIIDSRRTETSIVIKDGYTLAIGGLTENTISKESSRVPFIGDVPGIGRLFRSDSDSIRQRNLIIFITAKTLNPDGSTYKDVIDPRMIEQMDILPSEIPGYKVPATELQKIDELTSIKEKELREEEAKRLSTTIQAIEDAKYRKQLLEERKALEEDGGKRSSYDRL
ncbi:type II secretion system protein GspD [Coraliomargarita parva]|uniref:type II secretion system protein GspD n=1 Tax=Coraliomargarita parva TaxID=3014050 RepID=UPI0022B308D9|nr:secretin N-terminal domain-containing protein [Coraliomargarita parva]